MAITIEVAGEAVPLSAQSLIATLEAAVSSSTLHRQEATQQLDVWSSQPLYYDGLSHLFADRSQKSELRELAIILLKNGIDKFWRKTSRNAISASEKEGIKNNLFEAVLQEPEDRLASQTALALSKIARYEFPVDWPNALSIDLLRQYPINSMEFNRALLVYLRLVKELASVRLPRTKSKFQSSAPDLFFFLGEVYLSSVEEWRTGQSDGKNIHESTTAVNQLILLLKTIRQLVITGFDKPNRDDRVFRFWEQTSLTAFGTWPAWNPFSDDLVTTELIFKLYYQVAKLHLKMAEAHPAAFVLFSNFQTLIEQHWSISISRLGAYWQTTAARSLEDVSDNENDSEDAPIVKIGLSSLLLFRACAKMAFNPVHTFTSHIAKDREERDHAVEILRTIVFTESFASPVAQYLMVQFFSLQKEDLRDWGEDPDEWEQRAYGDSDAWEYSIRGCSEKLFLDLVINFKNVLVPQLIEAFNELAANTDADVFLKERILCAIGLAANVLFEKLNFGLYLEGPLLRDVDVQKPGYNILRRRIAILLGQWVPVMTSGLNRRIVYRIFRQILNTQDQLNDQVVRVAAGMQLKHVLEPFEFDVNEFLEDAELILRSLLDSMRRTKTAEVKIGLLETIRVVVLKMESYITPYANLIIQELSGQWVNTRTDVLINESIVAILSALVTSLKQESVNYLELLVPLILQALTNQDMQEYLLTEALDLLAAILIQTPDPLIPQSQNILSLVRPLMSILEFGSENVRQSLEILSSYALLAPTHIESLHFQLFSSLEPLLSSATSSGTASNNELASIVLVLVESLIKNSSISKQNEPNNPQSLTRSLMSSSLLSVLLSGIQSAASARITTGPKRVRTEVYGVVETDHLAVFMRLILADPDVLTAAIQYVCGEQNDTGLPPDMAAKLIEETLNHWDAIGDLPRKKLVALALTHLLTHQSTLGDTLRQHFQELLSIWTDVIVELGDIAPPDDISQTSTTPNRTDCLVLGPISEVDIANDPNATPEYIRQRRFEAMDPVSNIHLAQFVRTAVLEVVAQCGGEEAFRASFLDHVDQEVVRGFQALGVL